MSEATFFIRIDDPAEFRKAVLYSVRDMIKVLQRYERVKELRVHKAELVANLKRTTKDIQGTISDLESKLPDVEYEKPAKNKKVAEPATNKGKRAKIKVPKQQVKNELAALENELREIDEKIKLISYSFFLSTRFSAEGEAKTPV